MFGWVIVILLVLWLGLSLVGFVITGLFWLAVIGLVLFGATALFGWAKNKSSA